MSKPIRHSSLLRVRLHRFLTHPIYLFRLWRFRRELDAAIRRAGSEK